MTMCIVSTYSYNVPRDITISSILCDYAKSILGLRQSWGQGVGEWQVGQDGDGLSSYAYTCASRNSRAYAAMHGQCTVKTQTDTGTVTKREDAARVSYIVLASSSCSKVLRSSPSQLGDACSMQVFPAGMSEKERRRKRKRGRGRLVYCPSMSAQCSQG